MPTMALEDTSQKRVSQVTIGWRNAQNYSTGSIFLYEKITVKPKLFEYCPIACGISAQLHKRASDGGVSR